MKIRRVWAKFTCDDDRQTDMTHLVQPSKPQKCILEKQSARVQTGFSRHNIWSSGQLL